MSKYPNEDVARFDRQFRETETERNARLKRKRANEQQIEDDLRRKGVLK